MQITKKDILIMVIQFLTACLVFWICVDICHPFIIKDFQTPEIISKLVGVFLTTFGLFLGALFVAVTTVNVLYRKKW